jgi:Flp pilus assembly protein TadD
MIAGDVDEAEVLLRSALALRPVYAEAHRLLGLVYESRGSLEPAARELEIAVAMVPGFVAARLDLVRLLRVRGELALAEALEAPRRRADSPQVRPELGRLRERQGRDEEA